MTQDEIIEMARQVIDLDTDKRGRNTFLCDEYGLEAFAKLVAEHEREACWNVVAIALLGSDRELTKRVANAIRARGQA
jgi:hypothetical protein